MPTATNHDRQQHHAKFGTTAVHVGSEPDPSTGAVVAPISLATTFAQHRPGEQRGRDDPNSYHAMSRDPHLTNRW